MDILTTLKPHDSSETALAEKPNDGATLLDWRCLLAFASAALGTLVQNGYVHPPLHEVAPWAVNANSVLFGVIFGVIAFYAQRAKKPIVLFPMTVISIVSLTVGSLLWHIAIGQNTDPALSIAGSAFISVGRCWAVIMTGIALSGLQPKAMLTTAASGMLLAYALFIALDPVYAACATVAYTALPSLALILVFKKAQTLYQSASETQDAPSGLELTNPHSFISPASRLIVCIFVFELAFGLSIAFGDEIDTGWQGAITGIALLLIVCWILKTKNATREDSLYHLSGFLVIGGFLLADAGTLEASLVSHTMFSMGGQAFHILTWVTLAAIASRNPAGQIVIFARGFCASGIGAGFGLILGNLIKHFGIAYGSEIATFTNALCGLVFFAFAWIGLKGFSFADTIAGIKPAETVVITLQESDISKNCCSLSSRFELTERESEILALLAKGRNGSFIQTKYRITRNTVKTHVRHIYQKLGVHTQQELIDLVEGDSNQ